jgi:hypothetical protein
MCQKHINNRSIRLLIVFVSIITLASPYTLEGMWKLDSNLYNYTLKDQNVVF